MGKADLRGITLDIREVEEEGADISKNLNAKVIEIEKFKKEAMALHS